MSDINKEEIEATIQRLHGRLSSVEIHYNISQNETQIEVLQKNHKKIESLVETVQSNSPETADFANIQSCDGETKNYSNG